MRCDSPSHDAPTSDPVTHFNSSESPAQNNTCRDERTSAEAPHPAQSGRRKRSILRVSLDLLGGGTSAMGGGAASTTMSQPSSRRVSSEGSSESFTSKAKRRMSRFGPPPADRVRALKERLANVVPDSENGENTAAGAPRPQAQRRTSILQRFNRGRRGSTRAGGSASGEGELDAELMAEMLKADDPTRIIDKERELQKDRFEREERTRARALKSRRRLSSKLDEKLKELSVGTPWGKKRVSQDMMQGLTPEEGVKLIQDCMAKDMVRVSTLFRDFDADGSGYLDKDEFYIMVTQLLRHNEAMEGVDLARSWSDNLFDQIDSKGDGEITERMLYSQLKIGETRGKEQKALSDKGNKAKSRQKDHLVVQQIQD